MCCFIQTTLAYFQAASGVQTTICESVRGLSYRPWMNGLWFSYFFISLLVLTGALLYARYRKR
jgi:hypothetical protein